jgi:hypothetical protein
VFSLVEIPVLLLAPRETALIDMNKDTPATAENEFGEPFRIPSLQAILFALLDQKIDVW